MREEEQNENLLPGRGSKTFQRAAVLAREPGVSCRRARALTTSINKSRAQWPRCARDLLINGENSAALGCLIARSSPRIARDPIDRSIQRADFDDLRAGRPFSRFPRLSEDPASRLTHGNHIKKKK